MLAIWFHYIGIRPTKSVIPSGYYLRRLNANINLFMVSLFAMILHYRIEMTINSKWYTKVVLLQNPISSSNQDLARGFKDMLLLFHFL